MNQQTQRSDTTEPATTSDSVESQDEIFAFLSDPATHEGVEVTRIDTHGAAVFLAGERVFKVKRAVQFPFLDYSTVEKRKAACEAELRVNRPFAPQIYLGVVAITRDDGGALALNGDGTPVDYALEMQRFDESTTLDRLADAGRIDARLADDLGRAVADAHRISPAVDAEPWIGALASYIDQNEEALREWPELFATRDVEKLTGAHRRMLPNLRPLLRKRGTMNLVRRGHGDLHLGNIALIAGRPILFDAIEFDPLVATGDVLYDLAFLLMDLAERKLPQAATIVFNRYLAETARDEDFDALAALPFFLSMRAAIRAKVIAAKLDNAEAGGKTAIEKSAEQYFALALQLIAPRKPVLVAVGGLSGTGKSLLAKSLAADLPPVPGAVVLRSDVMRKRLFNKAETEKLPADAYAPEVTARIYSALAAQARRVLTAGHSAIVDAVFAKDEERDQIAKAAPAGVPFRGLFLTADTETRIVRVGARVGDASDADADVVRRQVDYDLGIMTWDEIDASDTPDDTLARANANLGQ